MKKNAKLLICGALGVLMLFGYQANAQDETPLTDDELKKYAMVMDFAAQEKERMQKDYNELIQAEELMQGGRRFQELKGAKGDEAKLAELSATEEELAVFNGIQTKYEEMVGSFKEAYTAKIKDKEQLGAGLYNRIGKALKADEEVKGRYEAILEGVKAERQQDESVEDES
ncbi:MAG: hypothetical protein ACR2MX_17620 [Cyclobacteriaceae bacterium]